MKNFTNMIRPDYFLRIFLKTFLILLISGMSFQVIYSQVPMNARNNKSTVNIGDLESINLYDGQFRFKLPLAFVGGRSLSNGLFLTIEQKWRRESVITGYSGAMPNITEFFDPDPFQLTGIKSQIGGTLSGSNKVNSTVELYGDCVKSNNTEFNLSFVGNSGESYTFWSEQNENQPIIFNPTNCSGTSTDNFSLGTVFNATDGSGVKFISDAPVIVSDAPDLEMNYPSGFIYIPNGTKYRIHLGGVIWAEDRNGNKTYSNVGPNGSVGIRDSLNREIQITSNGIEYKGFGGANRIIQIDQGAMSTALRSGETIKMKSDLFPNVAVDSQVNSYVVRYVQFPGDRKYKFFYNSYAELARVEIPEGGAIEYDYELACSACTERRLKERRVYSNTSTLENKTQYTYGSYSDPYSPSSMSTNGSVTSVKILDGLGNTLSLTKHYFAFCPITDCSANPELVGRETKTEIYAANETTLLRKIITEYEPRTRGSWSTAAPYKDIRPTNITTTLADSGQVSKVIYGYDSTAPYNLQTDIYEYDYDQSFLRRSHTDYEKGLSYTANSVNLLNLPTQTWVSSDSAGSNLVSRTTYEYDNYGTSANHAGLVDRFNISGHESAYGIGFLTRGNVTKVTSFSNANNSSGGVSTYSQYDIAGNVVKTIDGNKAAGGNGNENLISYDDCFGSPDAGARCPTASSGQQTYAFPTSSTNSASYTTYTQFDFYTGKAVDTEDINGNVSTTFYNDALDRPTQSISANNRSAFRKQTTAIYDDTNKKITVTSDSKSYSDNFLKSEAFYDGLGRTIESRDYLDASNYIATKTQYDSLGRAYRSSNSFRPYLSEQPQWTTIVFDSLGRVSQVQSPDNGVVSRNYYGSTTTITDQAGRQRSGFSDAIGRLLRVNEDPNGMNYETTYTYDTLGRLRKTTQGGQNRYFMYNDLGRLIRAKQPEQTANTSLNLSDSVTGNTGWSVKYEYDPNGNIISTTDTRNFSITAIYDNLNRLTSRNYSDSTPDVSFTYDGPNILNSKGQLTAVSSSVSANYNTSFDELGRVKSSQQVTDGQTYNFPDYTYDLSGSLIQQTYSSNRVVKIETDNLGRLSRVRSQNPNQGVVTYLSNLTYTSAGAVSRARLGNGNWESAQFDAKTMQVTEIGVGNRVGNTDLLKLEYNYGTTTSTTSDNNGSLRRQKISYAGQSAPIVQNYSYDSLNRLQTAAETVGSAAVWNQKFQYDRYGNRRFDSANTSTLPVDNAVYNPNVDPSTNRFLVSEGYNYDSEGNLISNPESQLLQYDAENRQIQVQNTALQTSANYYYDGAGKRVLKIIGQDETVFVYDAFGKMTAEYSTTIDAAKPKTINYLTSDALGSPRLVTNTSAGVVSRHDYQPFGEEISANVGGRTNAQGYQGIDGVRQQFTGYERDAESGLDYAQARYYSNKHGRFTSVDPLTASANMRNPQTFNRYSYGLNSPYKFTDPLGLAATQHCWGGICNTYDADEQAALGEQAQLESDDDGTVSASSVTPTVVIPFGARGTVGGRAGTASLPGDIHEALTNAAQTIEQNQVAATQNRDTALKNSKDFIDTVDKNNFEFIDDVKDAFVNRDTGHTASDGMVVLPSEISQGATSVQAGGGGSVKGFDLQGSLGTSSNVATYYNTALKSAEKANDQRRVVNRMSSESSQDRSRFIERFNNTIVYFKTDSGQAIKANLTSAALGTIYDNAITSGLNAANRQLFPK